MDKPIAEVLAIVYAEELSKLSANPSLSWEGMEDTDRRVHLGAMHSVVKTLGLFGLKMEAKDGQVNIVQIAAQAPPTTSNPPKSSLRGYTGESCQHCGGMYVVRTGTCSTCRSCGETTGCG